MRSCVFDIYSKATELNEVWNREHGLQERIQQQQQVCLFVCLFVYLFVVVYWQNLELEVQGINGSIAMVPDRTAFAC